MKFVGPWTVHECTIHDWLGQCGWNQKRKEKAWKRNKTFSNFQPNPNAFKMFCLLNWVIRARAYVWLSLTYFSILAYFFFLIKNYNNNNLTSSSWETPNPTKFNPCQPKRQYNPTCMNWVGYKVVNGGRVKWDKIMGAYVPCLKQE